MAPDDLSIETKAGTVNPITAEIIRYALLSVPNQIDVNITRTAYSPLVYEYKDYAVGIVDPEGRLISQSSGGIPLFVANALGTAVNDGIAIHGRDGIAPGTSSSRFTPELWGSTSTTSSCIRRFSSAPR